MSAPCPALTIYDLLLRRGSFQLGPLSLRVAAGRCTAIVGPSGSGKTTLLRCIAGFETPDAGRIAIGGRAVCGDGRPVPPDRRGLGFVFQDGALWPHLTALQHLTFAAPALGRDGARALLASAGLGQLHDRRPDSLSGGEAQRLALLRALAPAPPLLLLDEPLRSIDVHRRDELVVLLHRLAAERELTVVLVTHDRDEALALASDLVVLHEGRIVERGDAAQLLQQPRTAFTARLLGGAACLPAHAVEGGYRTPLGVVAAATNGAMQLAVLPGDLRAVAAADPDDSGPTGIVTACLPDRGGHLLQVALGDQRVPACSPSPLPRGSTVRLQFTSRPRLLPLLPAEDA